MEKDKKHSEKNTEKQKNEDRETACILKTLHTFEMLIRIIEILKVLYDFLIFILSLFI